MLVIQTLYVFPIRQEFNSFFFMRAGQAENLIFPMNSFFADAGEEVFEESHLVVIDFLVFTQLYY